MNQMKHLRIYFSLKMAGMHLLACLAVALAAALVVLGLWYPSPYQHLAGGQGLLFLVIGVDVVCGPLLTAVLSNPAKSRVELACDLGLVAVLQIAALSYGLWSVWEARPLYLVHEVDRFKVISAHDVERDAITALPHALQPSLWAGPLTVSIRAPKDAQERQQVMFESVQGGRDYAERPNFYKIYDAEAARNALERSQPLTTFLQKYPAQQKAAEKMLKVDRTELAAWRYLPVMGRQDWIAILSSEGEVAGFLPGDGF